MDISLALGSGGVSGFAHIGVIRSLESHGYRIRAVAGTSIGGLIGAVYAAGFTPEEIESYSASLDQRAFFRRTDPDGPGVRGLAGVTAALRESLGDKHIEDFPLPFGATAVDMNTAELLALKEGPALEAILATIAVPGVFPPQPWKGRQLIDGGTRDPVPVHLVRHLAPGLPVVAVVLSRPMADWKRRPPLRIVPKVPLISGWIARNRLVRALDVFLRAMDITSKQMIDHHLALTRPEVIVRPQTFHLGLLEEIDIPAIARLGEEAAEYAYPELEQAFQIRRRLARRLDRRLMNAGRFYHDP